MSTQPSAPPPTRRPTSAHPAFVEQGLRLLLRTHSGVSRKDLLSALGVSPARWLTLRDDLVATGEVVVRGRGPGMRLYHRKRAPKPQPVDLARARRMLDGLIRSGHPFALRQVEDLTHLAAEVLLPLLQEAIAAGTLARTHDAAGPVYAPTSDAPDAARREGATRPGPS